MERERAIQIAREIFPRENRRGILNILFEHTMYPAYDPDIEDHEPLLRAELVEYLPRYEQKVALKAQTEKNVESELISV